MTRRTHSCFACTLLLATLASSSRGPPDLEVATSKHVILRWDPNEHQLCGGTLEHVDNTLEVIAGTYGASLGSRPSITIFWLKSDIAERMCLPVIAFGCTRPQLNGTSMLFVPTPVFSITSSPTPCDSPARGNRCRAFSAKARRCAGSLV